MKWIRAVIISALIIAATADMVQMSRLDNEITSLHTEIGNLSSDIDGLKGDISNLQSRTGDIEYNIEQQKYDKEQTISTSQGEFRVTVYTPQSDGGRWGYQTATGAKSEHLKTCAVDKNVIPLGTTIDVDGLELSAVDTGSAVKGNVIDIFYDGSERKANKWINNFGTQHEVEVKR